MINQRDLTSLLYFFGLTCLWWLILLYAFLFLTTFATAILWRKKTTAVFGNGLKFQNNIRSSQQKCSLTRGILKNFTNFTGNYLCWSLFLIKLQINNILNLSYFALKIKKAKTPKTDTLKICRFPELKIKLIILQ